MASKICDSEDEVPIKYQERSCTDKFCMIIGLSFTAIILITSFIIFNNDHYIKTSFPSDSAGRVCGFDLKSHPYVYFANFPQTNQRLCVQKCPQNEQQKLACMPTDDISCSYNSNPSFFVGFYENNPEVTAAGAFCTPKDESAKTQLLKKANISSRYYFFKNFSTILLSLLFSLILSIAFVLLVQFLPIRMNYLAIFAGLIIILMTVIFVYIFDKGSGSQKLVITICLLLLFGIILFQALANKEGLEVHAIFLKRATSVVKQIKQIVLFIPIFLVVLVLFSLIIILEIKSFWSSSAITFDQNNLYYNLSSSGTTIKSILIFIQVIWGLTFIKESFNFCICHATIFWFYKRQQQYPGIFEPLKIIVCKHFGSIVGASFMTGFFSIADYVFDFLRPASQSQECYASVFNKGCGCCSRVTDLVRSDSMAYINLTGNQFCNSSRYCEYLCEESILTRNSQSNSRSYRICSHFLLSGIASIINLFLQGQQSSLYIMLFVFFITLFISTLFISLHADITQAIHIAFLFNENFIKRRQGQSIGVDYSGFESMSKEDQQSVYKEYKKGVLGKHKLRKSLAREISQLEDKVQ